MQEYFARAVQGTCTALQDISYWVCLVMFYHAYIVYVWTMITYLPYLRH